MNITLRQLRAFVAVAQLGGFSAAAGRLHLTQPALSMLIRSLEQELGVALFERTTRTVHLTDSGRVFLPEAEKMLTDLHSAVATTRHLAELGRGRIVAAVAPTFAATLLPTILRRFRALSPGAQVLVRDEPSPARLRQMVLDGEADLGIGPFEREQRALLVVDVLMTDALVLACPAGHRLLRRAKVRWADLQEHPVIGFAAGNSLHALAESAMTAARVRLRNEYEVTSIASAIGMVGAGLGVSVLPSYAKRVRPAQRIGYRPLVEPVVTRDLCLFRLRDRAMPPAAQAFIAAALAGTSTARAGTASGR
jgi:LysR family transcriptional regulator, carnitine catabolism transcriptional activator